MHRCFSRQPRSMRHAVPPVSTLLPPLRHTLLSICNTASRSVSPPTEKLFSMRCPAPLSPIRITKKGAVFRTPVSNPPVLPAFSASVLHSMPQLQPRRSIRRNPTPGNLLAAGFRVLPAAYAYLRLASGIASGALVSCFTFSVTGL